MDRKRNVDSQFFELYTVKIVFYVSSKPIQLKNVLTLSKKKRKNDKIRRNFQSSKILSDIVHTTNLDRRVDPLS